MCIDVLTVVINSPIIGNEEMHAVMRVLESGILTSVARLGGPAVRELERSARGFVKSKYAVVVNSGTVLQCAFYALRAGHGKEVLIPSFTFVATANAVIATGVKPVFVDIL